VDLRLADDPAALGRHAADCAAGLLAEDRIGRAGVVAVSAVVTNAVIDALSPYGITNIDMPVTSDKVWAALRSKGVTE